MSANVGLDVALSHYALERVLFHLSEDEQAKQPRYSVHSGRLQARAAARVLVKRQLALTRAYAALLWRAAKESE